MQSRQRLLISVLAAGESRRFQGAKLAQSLATSTSEDRGQSLLQRHIACLANFIVSPNDRRESLGALDAELLVVIGAHQTLLRPDRKSVV